MAYNKKNYYKRIIEIQEIVKKEKFKNGKLQKEIYWAIVQPKYLICERTFSTYLSVNAKKLLKDLEQKEQRNQIVTA
ncbi:hypothetical protein AX766_03940 [Flavobacterium covae]|nr:hypothetical protein AX766_03940 [Flavobacterium covae]